MANSQNKTEKYKNMPSDKLIEEISSVVLQSTRPMPAVFTSNGDRKQSFCVDFEDIDPDDEYQMASASWYWVGQYMEQGNNFTEKEVMIIIRCGEDLMISSYVIEKIKRKEIHEEVASEVTEANKRRWSDEMNINQLFSTKSAKDWFNFCKSYGVQVAQERYL